MYQVKPLCRGLFKNKILHIDALEAGGGVEAKCKDFRFCQPAEACDRMLHEVGQALATLATGGVDIVNLPAFQHLCVTE